MPQSAYIVAACRSAAGRGKGALRNWHPVSLGAAVVNDLLSRVPSLNPADVDDVVLGCVSQIGEQGANVARNVVLSSKLPLGVPGTTVDRQCGSSQQAIHFAAQAVMSGTQDIVICGGVESMTRQPIFSNMPKEFGKPNDDSIKARFNDKSAFFSQFVGAELMAKTFGVTRGEMDAFAARSHVRAHAATQAGKFAKEIAPLKGHMKDGSEFDFAVDEGIRKDTSVEKLAALDTLVKLGVCSPVPGGAAEGVITAGNASQISDGAAMLLIVNDNGLKKLGAGVKPMARIRSLALAANDPVLMLSAPIPASELALKKAGLKLSDIGLYEVNEAFAVVPMAWAKHLKADESKLNVNGGACALGHPLGATGAKLMTTLVHEMVRTQTQFGLLSICEGGGTANATIVELL